jgi:hypothetical protein
VGVTLRLCHRLPGGVPILFPGKANKYIFGWQGKEFGAQVILYFLIFRRFQSIVATRAEDFISTGNL